MKTRREKILRQPVRYSGGIPQYSLGGILTSTAVGAGTGAIGGGGVLSVPGAIIGGVAGLATGLVDHFKEKKLERQQEAQQALVAQQMGAAQVNAGGSLNNFTNPWMAAKGGVVQGGSPVKLRNKEMLIGPDGTALPTEKVGARRPVDDTTVTLEDGTVIVSPENTAQAKAIAARQKPEITKWNKVLNSNSATPLQRKTASRRLEQLKAEYQPLIVADAQKRVQEGGTPMGGGAADWGAIMGAGKTFLKNNGKDLLQGAAQLAPTLYNMGRSMQPAENLNPAAFQNPLAYSALDTMRNRQPNMTPALQASDAAVAGADANIRSTASGRGQYMAGRIALENASMTNKSNIYAQGQQQRNQYLGEYGQTQGALGQKMADTNLMVSDLNARNQAAQRNFGAAAAGQLSQYSQIQQQMNNQKSRDDMMMNQYMSWMKMFSGGTGGFNKADTSNVGYNSPGGVNPSAIRPYRGGMVQPDNTFNTSNQIELAPKNNWTWPR